MADGGWLIAEPMTIAADEENARAECKQPLKGAVVGWNGGKPDG
jgi:hypothetical protein